jgi:myo-inositol-1(or 4)-monophosphatase
MLLQPREETAVVKFLSGESIDSPLEFNEDTVTHVGLMAVLQVGRLLQKARLAPDAIHVEYKIDGTRVTNCDKDGEALAREIIGRAFPDHLIIGEEQGGEMDPNRYSWIIDPIDSTNSFLSHENTPAVSLCLMYQGTVLFSAVYNPFSSELFYSSGNSSRLIRSYGIGATPMAHALPLPQTEQGRPHRFVNVHPTSQNDDFHHRMAEAKTRREIDKVLRRGGSPAFSLVSITKGSFGMVHDAGEEPAKPWDFAAAISIVRTAGGRVTKLDNGDIPLVGHRGPFVASMREDFHQLLLRLASE